MRWKFQYVNRDAQSRFATTLPMTKTIDAPTAADAIAIFEAIRSELGQDRWREIHVQDIAYAADSVPDPFARHRIHNQPIPPNALAEAAAAFLRELAESSVPRMEDEKAFQAEAERSMAQRRAALEDELARYIVSFPEALAAVPFRRKAQ